MTPEELGSEAWFKELRRQIFLGHGAGNIMLCQCKDYIETQAAEIERLKRPDYFSDDDVLTDDIYEIAERHDSDHEMLIEVTGWRRIPGKWHIKTKWADDGSCIELAELIQP